jgi:isopentenyl-diphosphate delta-isomerase
VFFLPILKDTQIDPETLNGTEAGFAYKFADLDSHGSKRDKKRRAWMDVGVGVELMSSIDMKKSERVVLLDEQGQAIGSARKESVHTADTPLHSALSIFLFDGMGSMLVQRRALSKTTWPGVWSNACCGHPAPGEDLMAAASRRLQQELGLEGISLQVALPHFRYQAKWEGLLENEMCPVLIGTCPSGNSIRFNTDEVHEVNWIPWQPFATASVAQGKSEYDHFSPWSLLEARQLRESPALQTLLGPEA